MQFDFLRFIVFIYPTALVVATLNEQIVIVRLLNAFAEEQATEDAVYYMGEALRKGIVELDVFLKVNALNMICCQ